MPGNWNSFLINKMPDPNFIKHEQDKEEKKF